MMMTTFDNLCVDRYSKCREELTRLLVATDVAGSPSCVVEREDKRRQLYGWCRDANPLKANGDDDDDDEERSRSRLCAATIGDDTKKDRAHTQRRSRGEVPIWVRLYCLRLRHSRFRSKGRRHFHVI